MTSKKPTENNDVTVEEESKKRTIRSLPNQPITERHVKKIGESNAVIGAMPFPGEEHVQGMLFVKSNDFVAVAFDRVNNVWKLIETYSRETHSMPHVMQQAVNDRTTWLLETGQLNELLSGENTGEISETKTESCE